MDIPSISRSSGIGEFPVVSQPLNLQPQEHPQHLMLSMTDFLADSSISLQVKMDIWKPQFASDSSSFQLRKFIKHVKPFKQNSKSRCILVTFV